MPQITVQGNFQWVFARDPDSDTWIGVCDALNLNAIGDSFMEFQQCANDAMQALFADLFADGELEAFLRRNGWQQFGVVPRNGTTPRFDVPFNSRQTSIGELAGAGA